MDLTLAEILIIINALETPFPYSRYPHSDHEELLKKFKQEFAKRIREQLEMME